MVIFRILLNASRGIAYFANIFNILSFEDIKVSKLASLNLVLSIEANYFPSAIFFLSTTSLIYLSVAYREPSRRGADIKKNTIKLYTKIL